MYAAIVLAAGQATRFGHCKQLLKIGARTVIERVLDNLRASHVDEIVVVLGARADEIREKVHIKERVIVNSGYANGMSTSIQAGLGALSESVEGALIVLGDQPFVNWLTFDQLIDEHLRTGADVVIPTYDGARGNPVLIGKSLFADMSRIRGDIGCRAVFHEHAQSTVKVPVDDRGVLIDIDTLEDVPSESAVGSTPPARFSDRACAFSPTTSVETDRAARCARPSSKHS